MKFMKVMALIALMSFSLVHASEGEKYSAKVGVEVIASIGRIRAIIP